MNEQKTIGRQLVRMEQADASVRYTPALKLLRETKRRKPETVFVASLLASDSSLFDSSGLPNGRTFIRQRKYGR